MRLIRLLKKDLARESSEWVDDGIITVEQAEAISARYGLDFHQLSESSLGYNVLIGLGYLFVGLAVLTILSANWEDIPRSVRMTGLVLMTLATHTFGVRNYVQGKQSSAIGLFFMGSLFYGASIMLIAQIYHIDEHFPDGILWWGLGVLPFAFFLESTLLMLLATTLAMIWLFVESSLQYFPSLFPLFMCFTAWHAFRVKQSYVLFLTLVIGLGFWTEFLLAWFTNDNNRFDFGAENVVYCIALFILFAGLARWLLHQGNRMWQDYGTLLGIWTLRFSIATLFIFSFEDPLHELINADWEQPQLIIGLAIGLPVASVLLSYFSSRQFISLTVISLFFITCFLAILRIGSIESDYLSIYIQILINIFLVATGIWLIFRGIREAITHYFYFGILTILLVALLRYIDLVGDYVGAAILFAIFAVILLTTASYWKKYKTSHIR